MNERTDEHGFERGARTTSGPRGRNRPGPYDQQADSRPLELGEVDLYARKSDDDKGAAKSIADQIEECFETAAEWGLPVDESSVRAEKPGHSGSEWWLGGGAPGLEGYSGPKANTRPVMTEIMNRVVAGQVRVVVVWSLCRLWRDVGICEAAMKVFAACGCQIYDRNGPVNISTPDGRNAVRAAAISAQNMREMSAVNSPRGIRKSRGKGKLVVGANRLGFRSAGGTTGQVRHVPEEQELVREIFRRYDTGWSVDQIARWLTDENYQWLTDVSKPAKAKGTPTTAIHKQTIRNLLGDCRYQGRQPHAGEEWPCPVFLVDGQPVVPTDLFERVQAKLRSRSRGAPSHATAQPLSSLMRCGLCGQSMRAHRTTQRYKSGKVVEWYTWKSLHHPVECWCTHDLPVLYVNDVNDFVATVLGPLLMAELQDRAGESGQAALMGERAGVARDLKAAEHRLSDELPAEWERGQISLDLLGNMERSFRERITSLKERLCALDGKLTNTAQLVVHAKNINDESLAVRRDALRAVLRWVAVFPTVAPRVRNAETGYKWSTQPDAGRVVFLTIWGTYFTAFIERKKMGDHRARLCFLRPATPEEMVGTVADFPDPDAFVAGLARAYENRRYAHSRNEVAPGYSPGRQSPVAEFCEDCTDNFARGHDNEHNAN